MLFRKLILVLIISIQTLTIVSQTVVRVFDKSDGSPLPCAHVTLIPIASGKSLTEMTKPDGNLQLSEAFLKKNQKFKLRISYLGYETFTDTFSIKPEIAVGLISDNKKINEVVVTAQYSPGHPEKAVHKIKVIGAEKIKEMAAISLRDVLANETNIRLSQDGILGSSMSMQGISGENVKILIDGVPVIGRLDGNIDLSQINLNDIEQIEIIEGPMSVNFGTNALAGTINLITRKEAKDKLSFGLNSYVENTGTYDFSGHSTFRHGKNTFMLSGGRNYFDGWAPEDAFLPDFSKTPADSSRSKRWKPKEQYLGRLQYYRDIKKIKVGIKAEAFNETITNRGRPLLPYSERAFDDYYHTQRFDQAITASGELSPSARLNLVASANFYRRIKNTYIKDLTNLNELLSASPGDQDTSYYRQFMSRAGIATSVPNRWYNYEIGYDLSHESAEGVRIQSKNKSMGDYSVFSSGEFSVNENFIIRPGLRFTYNTTYKAPVSPAINLKYSFANSNLRLSFAKGFRAPSIKELYFTFVDINHNILGNEALKAESSDNVSINYSWKKIVNQKAYQFDVSGFYNAIRQMIQLANISGPTGNEYSYINIGKYKTSGGSLGFIFRRQHFNLNIIYSLTGHFNEIADDFDIDPFSFSSEIKTNLSYSWKQPGVSLNFFHKYQGLLPGYSVNEDKEVILTHIGEYHMAEVNISKSLFHKQLIISTGIKNLFNVREISSATTGGIHSGGENSIPVGMGRMLFLKIDYTFSRS
jgi:outer membrane receptor for ferrienterochelin and colicins